LTKQEKCAKIHLEGKLKEECMLKFAHKIKYKLNSIISQMSKNTEQFVKNPNTDFTRNRKLSFSTTLKILL